MSEVSSSRDLTKPFEIFVGRWHGGATIFDREGIVKSYWPSDVSIYWNEDGTLHYEQYIDQLAEEFNKAKIQSKDTNGPPLNPVAIGEQVLSEWLSKPHGTRTIVNLRITGKRAEGKSTDGNYYTHAQESAPGNYLFMIRDLRSTYVYCNNHFFVNPELRQIVGPTLASSEGPTAGPECPPVCPTVPGLVQATNIQTFTRVSYSTREARNEQPVTAPPPKPPLASKEDWRRALFAKAWLDEPFKKLLASDRKAALASLAQEHGVDVNGPPHVSIEIIQDLIKEQHDCPPPACC